MAEFKIKTPNYICPVHGPQGNAVGWYFDITTTLGARYERKYCLECMVGFLDGALCQLVQAEED